MCFSLLFLQRKELKFDGEGDKTKKGRQLGTVLRSTSPLHPSFSLLTSVLLSRGFVSYFKKNSLKNRLLRRLVRLELCILPLSSLACHLSFPANFFHVMYMVITEPKKKKHVP